MAQKPRGVMEMIWKNFIASFKIMTKSYRLVGTDRHGTEYYEEVPNPRIRRNRLPRYYEPKDPNTEPELPTEWESWLRYRRKEPPTEEEIDYNYRISVLKKVNAARLEEKHKLLKGKDEKVLIPEKPGFPTYEEYKNEGRDYKLK